MTKGRNRGCGFGTRQQKAPHLAGLELCMKGELPRLAIVPIVNVFTDFVLGLAVAFLDLAFQLLATAIDLRQVVVSELSPLLLDLAGHLLPTTFNAVPVHIVFLSKFDGE
jgi:hypothetical protein